eukprot:GHUV01018377.1.p1 GENE.GHUV01018377.1~~GHUV01018377.1.p1  ORF type:complete len:246 (+),score=70.28 GHUV01018377.1:603-1340(+)
MVSTAQSPSRTPSLVDLQQVTDVDEYYSDSQPSIVATCPGAHAQRCAPLLLLQITVQEIGGANCIVLQQDAALGSVSTIVLRGSTEGFLDDVERAVDDGINAYKALCRDARCVPAGGAAEIEMARQVADFGKKQTGLDQYAIARFAEALEVVPRTIAENSGLQASEVLARLYAAHSAGQVNMGVDIEDGSPKDLSQEGIMDVYVTKWWAVKLATDAVVTVLKVDQIIMAKQAGGPKPRMGDGDDD